VGGERPVPAGLPRDVRVQADESRLSDEVDPELAGEREELRERIGRAPAARAIRVVDADPDGASPLGVDAAPALEGSGRAYASPARSFW
jgi:hypothetical protein